MNARKEVVGILVAGKPNVGIYETSRGCGRYNRCDNSGKNCLEIYDENADGFPHTYSKVQKITEIKKLLSL